MYVFQVKLKSLVKNLKKEKEELNSHIKELKSEVKKLKAAGSGKSKLSIGKYCFG